MNEYTGVYVTRSSDDELKHWKYIKRVKVNGKWRYYYEKPKEAGIKGLAPTPVRTMSALMPKKKKLAKTPVRTIGALMNKNQTKIKSINNTTINKGKKYLKFLAASKFATKRVIDRKIV